MMTRDDMNEMVIDYLYDDLPAERRASFEEALPSFPEISAEVRSNTALRQALRSIKPAEVPEGLAHKIMAQAEQENAKRQPERESFFSWLTGVIMQPAFAAAMVFAVVGGTTFVLNEQGEGLSETSHEEPRSVTTDTTPTAARAPAPTSHAPTLALAPQAPPAAPAPARTSRAAAPAAQAPSMAASSARTKRKESLAPRKKARRAPRMNAKAAKSSKPNVAVTLHDTKEELYRGLGSRNLSSQVAEAAAGNPGALGLAHESQSDAEPALRVAEQKQKPSKTAPAKQSNKRLVAAFERAIKKRQFSEARKLLGLIGERPGLRKFYKAKRALIPTQKRKSKGK